MVWFSMAWWSDENHLYCIYDQLWRGQVQVEIKEFYIFVDIIQTFEVNEEYKIFQSNKNA